MGTEYYLVNDGKGEVFHLGRGPWSDHILVMMPRQDYISAYADRVNAAPPVARKMLSLIWQWCNERNWEVSLMSDADNDFERVQDYRETGECFIEEIDNPDELMNQVATLARELRIDLCAEEVEIKVTIPSPDSDETIQYYSIIGDHVVEHGYYISVVKEVALGDDYGEGQ